MTKERFKKKDRSKIDVELNEAKYTAEYIDYSEEIAIRRVVDNKIVALFSNMYQIVEIDSKDSEVTNFVAIGRENKGSESELFFYHFNCKPSFDRLNLVMSHTINNVCIEQIRFGKNNFVLNDEYKRGYKALYNLEKVSDYYFEIHAGQKVEETFGRPIVFVEEQLSASLRSDIKDKITYGIDPNTYEVITPIYSELQNKYINLIPSREEAAKILGRRLNTVVFYPNEVSPLNLTKQLEIEYYLEKLSSYIEEPKRITKTGGYSFDENQVDEQFVKSFRTNVKVKKIKQMK